MLCRYRLMLCGRDAGSCSCLDSTIQRDICSSPRVLTTPGMKCCGGHTVICNVTKSKHKWYFLLSWFGWILTCNFFFSTACCSRLLQQRRAVSLWARLMGQMPRAHLRNIKGSGRAGLRTHQRPPRPLQDRLHQPTPDKISVDFKNACVRNPRTRARQNMCSTRRPDILNYCAHFSRLCCPEQSLKPALEAINREKTLTVREALFRAFLAAHSPSGGRVCR